MGLFDWMLKGLGFDDDDAKSTKEPKPEKQEKIKTVKQNKQFTGAKFDFSKPVSEEKIEEPEKKDELENLEGNALLGNNVAVFSPLSKKDLEGVVDFTRKRQPAIVNLSALNQTDFERGLEFLNGAMFAMRGSVSQLDNKLYLVAPSGTATVLER